MHILVLGACGKVGSLVVQELLRRGHSVTGFVKESCDKMADDGYTQYVGNAREMGDLIKSLHGIDAVIYCIANQLFSPVDNLYSDTTRALISAMDECDIKRLVWLTGYTGNAVSDIPLWQRISFALPPFSRIYENKFLAEQYLQESSLDYTVVKSLFMTDSDINRSYHNAQELKIGIFGPFTTTRKHVAECLCDEAEKTTSVTSRVVWS